MLWPLLPCVQLWQQVTPGRSSGRSTAAEPSAGNEGKRKKRITPTACRMPCALLHAAIPGRVLRFLCRRRYIDSRPDPARLAILYAPLPHGKVAAHQPHEVALALDDVHRDDLFGEAMVLALSGGNAACRSRPTLCPRARQQVVPARDRAVVGIGVVPVADLVDVPADSERRPRRNADRACAIGGAKACAASRRACRDWGFLRRDVRSNPEPSGCARRT